MPSVRHTLLYPLLVCVIVLLLFNAALYGLLPNAQPVPALTPAAAFRLDFDRGLVNVQGWTRVGRLYDNSVQWTNAVPASITVPITASGALAVEFAVVDAISDAMFDQLELRVNGHVIPLTRNDKHYSGLIPAEAREKAGEPLTLLFYTPPPLRPVDLDPQSGDVRLLGIAFDWLEVRAAP